MTIKTAVLLPIVAITIGLFAPTISAQTVSVLTSGLKRPNKTILTDQGNLLVAETGTGIHDGRISIIDPQTGLRRTLLNGLPSAVGRYGLPQGPSSMVMRGRDLYITIGEGNPTVACDAPCIQIPNPAGASSPIFSSVLVLQFSANTEMITTGFTHTAVDDLALKNGQQLFFDNGGGDNATLELLADFYDTAPAPRRGAVQSVAASNPFGVEIIANHLYVTDGGMNNVWKVGIESGEIEELIRFPDTVLSLLRLKEAVPTGIRRYGNQLLVVLHRGGSDNFFRDIISEVRIVDPQTGADAPFIGGLTAAIDILPVPAGFRRPDYLHVLEFGVFAPPSGPGRKPTLLLRFDNPAGAPVSAIDLGNFATSMTRDPSSGDIYVTRIFTGAIVRVRFP